MAQARGRNIRAKRPAVRGTAKRASATGRSVKTELGAPLIATFIDQDGHVVVQRVAESFGMSKVQLAETVGLGREAFHKATRTHAANPHR